jgi:hypothetical protein
VHEALHIAILATTLVGGAGLAMVLVWPVIFDTPLPPTTRRGLLALVGIGLLLFLVEWQVVH